LVGGSGEGKIGRLAENITFNRKQPCGNTTTALETNKILEVSQVGWKIFLSTEYERQNYISFQVPVNQTD
jgi:hypothetical protein